MIGDAHMDPPGPQIVDITDLQFKILVHFQDLRGHVVIALPGKGERQTTGGTVKQSRAQGFFDSLDRLAEGGLGHKKLARCAGNAFFVCYGFYIDEFFACHRASSKAAESGI